jgi:hypothetical protein
LSLLLVHLKKHGAFLARQSVSTGTER